MSFEVHIFVVWSVSFPSTEFLKDSYIIFIYHMFVVYFEYQNNLLLFYFIDKGAKVGIAITCSRSTII